MTPKWQIEEGLTLLFYDWGTQVQEGEVNRRVTTELPAWGCDDNFLW